jgi:uncharacterized phage protein (TIGR01671 family)
MREIKFKGIDHAGFWRIGDLINWNCDRRNEWCAIKEGIVSHSVKESTIGQYTGLKDKNGVEIYDGDVIKYFHEHYGHIHTGLSVIEYHDCNFCLRIPSRPIFNIWLGSKSLKNIEIIGNIHENPEILGG